MITPKKNTWGRKVVSGLTGQIDRRSKPDVQRHNRQPGEIDDDWNAKEARDFECAKAHRDT
jgi:hypothetical protein